MTEAAFDTATSLPELFRRALDKHQKGQLPDAIALYDSVIAGDPAHAAAHHNRGAALSRPTMRVRIITGVLL